MASTIEILARQIAVAKNPSEDLMKRIKIAVKEANKTENKTHYLNAAIMKYVENSEHNIEIDGDALVSKGENGAFVSAWVWVPNEDAGLPE